MTTDLRTTCVFDIVYDQAKKVLALEGGSGASKTYSILQAYLLKSFEEFGQIYSIVRKTGPVLKRSCRRDWERILGETDLAPVFRVNRSEATYTNTRTGTLIEFMSLDDPMKAHGPRRDRLFCNEVNELSAVDWRALAKRTRGQIVVDYNPKMQQSYVYDEILTRPDCEHVVITYKDNDFLTDGERREIENAVPVYQDGDGEVVDWDLSYTDDPAFTGALLRGDAYEWAVYGLGRRGAPGEAIYPQVFTGAFPEEAETALGLDFGYNHATVLVRVATVDRLGRRPALHIDELFHGRKTLNSELIRQAPALGITELDTLWCDSSRPDLIQEWIDAGYGAEACEKGPGSVYSQVQWVKGYDLIFTPRSELSRAQHLAYRWKTRRDGLVLDEPIKLDDDAPDAVRYGAWNAFADANAFWSM